MLSDHFLLVINRPTKCNRMIRSNIVVTIQLTTIRTLYHYTIEQILSKLVI